jgi:glutamate carboxypeptidase
MSPPELDALRTAIEDFLPAYLRDMERLVGIDCGTYTKAGVDEVGAWTSRKLEELGASVARHANADFGDTIIGTWERDVAGSSVLVIGHLDTVFEPGTDAERPFAIRDRRAHGPGVSDMKAGLLTGLYAIAALRAVAEARSPDAATRSPEAASAPVAEWLPVGRLVFIANPDEEIGSPTSTPLIEEEARHADAALVLEGARENGDIVSARKGHLMLRFAVHGRAAHSGVEPEKGRNAILEAAHKTVALHALNGRFPGASVNVGVVQGGTRPNIVAESATLEIDVRAVGRRELEAVEAAIRAVADASSVPDTRTDIELLSRHWPMERTEASGWLVEHAVDVATRLGFDLHDAATGGASDGNTTSGLGVPTIDGLGPIGGLDHGPDEYVDLDSIVPRTTLLAGLLKAIGADPRFRGEPSASAAAGAGGQRAAASRPERRHG